MLGHNCIAFHDIYEDQYKFSEDGQKYFQPHYMGCLILLSESSIQEMNIVTKWTHLPMKGNNLVL